MKQSWNTIARTILSLSAAAGLTGCIVPCLNPLFAEKDLIFEPALLGKWTKDKETLDFQQADDKKEYRIINTNRDGRKATLCAQLGQLGGRLYLNATLDTDTLPEHSCWFTLPRHILIFRIERTTSELTLIPLNYEACGELLKAKPGTIAHVTLKPQDDKDSDAVHFLTATSADLQKFILEHGDKDGLFPQKEAHRFAREQAQTSL